MDKLLNFFVSRIFWTASFLVSAIICIFSPADALRLMNALVQDVCEAIKEEEK